jgi:hypothetical protein
MKKQMLVVASILTAHAVVGCKYEQNPLAEHPRAAEVNVTVDPKKATVFTTTTSTSLPPRIEYVDREVPVYKDRVVIKEVEVRVPEVVAAEEEQNWESARLFQIYEVSEISFVAGEESTATIRASVLHGNASFSLKILNLPAKASQLT